MTARSLRASSNKAAIYAGANRHLVLRRAWRGAVLKEGSHLRRLQLDEIRIKTGLVGLPQRRQPSTTAATSWPARSIASIASPQRRQPSTTAATFVGSFICPLEHDPQRRQPSTTAATGDSMTLVSLFAGSSKKAAIYDGCNQGPRRLLNRTDSILKEGSHLRRL